MDTPSTLSLIHFLRHKLNTRTGNPNRSETTKKVTAHWGGVNTLLLSLPLHILHVSGKTAGRLMYLVFFVFYVTAQRGTILHETSCTPK